VKKGGTIMWTRQVRAWAVALAAVVVMGSQVGCQSKRLSDERNELYTQNQELQDELNRTRSALDASMAQRTAQPAPAYAPAPAPAPMAASNSGFGDIAGVEVEQGFGSIRVKVPGDVLFASGQATVTQGSRATLNQVVAVIQRQYPNNRIVVEGHTDTDPIRRSRWASNQQLSEARAAAVADYLASQGISRSRIQTVGFGSTQPRDTKARSRRVEIVVLQ
jgi:flagellar motor protein MotB